MSGWPLTAWLAENVIWASLLMLLVLAIRAPVARFFGAGVAYALWLVPALRLVAPPATWIGNLFDTELPSLPPLLISIDGSGEAPVTSAGYGQWLPVLLALWAGGAILFLVYQAVCYRAFLRRLSLSAQSSGHHGGLPLVESEAVDGPIAVGLLDRRIVVPADFTTRYSPAERRLALDHERHHHRRGDIFINHLALAVLALNWFNPIAWAAFRAFRADQELSCDSAIAAAAPPETRCDYARALVKSASRPGLIAVCPLNHADQLKRRLKMLNHHRKDRRRLLAGSAVTATLIAASMTFGAAGHAQDKGQDKHETRERTIIIERHSSDHAEHGAQGGHAEGHRDGAVRRHLSPETAERIENCRSGNQVLNVNEGEGNQRTRMMICVQGGGSGSQVEALQSARERIAGQNELSAETRQRILAQIDAAIARARGGN